MAAFGKHAHVSVALPFTRTNPISSPRFQTSSVSEILRDQDLSRIAGFCRPVSPPHLRAQAGDADVFANVRRAGAEDGAAGTLVDDERLKAALKAHFEGVLAECPALLSW